MLDGAGVIGSTAVRAGQVAWLEHSELASKVALRGGDQGMRVLLFGGKPLREPVAARGPFVMNTEGELKASYAEFRAQGDRFGLQ